MPHQRTKGLINIELTRIDLLKLHSNCHGGLFVAGDSKLCDQVFRKCLLKKRNRPRSQTTSKPNTCLQATFPKAGDESVLVQIPTKLLTSTLQPSGKYVICTWTTTTNAIAPFSILDSVVFPGCAQARNRERQGETGCALLVQRIPYTQLIRRVCMRGHVDAVVHPRRRLRTDRGQLERLVGELQVREVPRELQSGDLGPFFNQL